MAGWNKSILSTTTDGFSQVRDIDYAYTGQLVRLTYYGPSTPRVDDWRDEAPCQSSDPTLFEYDDTQSREEQWPKIHEGMLICVDCPVRSMCFSGASPANKYWTTRGGRPPEGMFPDARRGKSIVDNSFAPQASGTSKAKHTRVRKEICKRGHNEWGLKADGNRRCLACARLDNENRKLDRLKRKGGTI